mgnify:CR=1 FL=1
MMKWIDWMGVGLAAGLILGAAGVETASPAEVSNREPRTGEVNYHPAEGEAARVNPPGFV